LVVLALIGIVIYFVHTYLQDKAASDALINSTISQLGTEKSDRLSNVKYVVDQVNTVNEQISMAFATSNAAFLKSVNDENTVIAANRALQTTQNAQFSSNIDSQSALSSNMVVFDQLLISGLYDTHTGFGHYITFNDKNQNGYSLFDLPSSPNSPSAINLMQNVNAMMGLTASNLSPANSVQFCYGPGQTNCSQFPNKDGDTVLMAAPTSASGFGSGRTNNIILASPTMAYGGISICDTVGKNCANISVNTSGSVLVNGAPIAPVASAPKP